MHGIIFVIKDHFSLHRLLSCSCATQKPHMDTKTRRDDWKWVHRILGNSRTVLPLLPLSWFVPISVQITMIAVNYPAVSHTQASGSWCCSLSPLPHVRDAVSQICLLSLLTWIQHLDARFLILFDTQARTHTAPGFSAATNARISAWNRRRNGRQAFFFFFCLTFLWPTHVMSPYLPSTKTRYWLCLSVGKANTKCLRHLKWKQTGVIAQLIAITLPPQRAWGVERPLYAPRHDLSGTNISTPTDVQITREMRETGLS